MKFIDDDSKKLYWWNRNYFFAGTLIICLINILLYMNTRSVAWFYNWSGSSTFHNVLKGVVSFFVHTTWQHVLLNMLCLLICGAWLERRKGTLEFLGLLCVMLLLIHLVEAAARGSYSYNLGFSPVNFGLYAYAVADYCFLFRKPTRTKINVISGAILMGLIYFASCFDGGRNSIQFNLYPSDLLNHLIYFSAGAILGLTIQLTKLAAVREKYTESPSYYVCKRFFPAERYRNYKSIGLDRDEIVTVDTAFFPPDEWQIYTEFVELAEDEQVLAVLKFTDDTKLPNLDGFEFCGFDLVQEGKINHNASVLMNSSSGYFSELLTSNSLNRYGLLETLKEARRIRKYLSEQYDYCEIYAIWRKIK